MRIICLFNLKPGASAQAYEAWARGTDIPGVNALGSVNSFTVHRATGLFGSEAAPPYDYIEVIDIKGMDAFVADVSNPEFQKVAAAFGQFTDNPCFILTEDL
ncbi:REDY-like protein HapK [Sandarakinorhabdus cyanobacteriorum]|uniref:REDY-like protein HapK n=1 Tax=Sandarakinorhabdus cyanobacteriorum TaxID=1981098 RepID=A0A255Y552_9SPHN|nr:REDY-like protein HapK [Sandarakinorhabdus cyanobacteriorum]OYQ24349.1 REDY-like protein HapK [Sandarakinorhabdus cyanobacteriorum]